MHKNPEEVRRKKLLQTTFKKTKKERTTETATWKKFSQLKAAVSMPCFSSYTFVKTSDRNGNVWVGELWKQWLSYTTEDSLWKDCGMVSISWRASSLGCRSIFEEETWKKGLHPDPVPEAQKLFRPSRVYAREIPRQSSAQSIDHPRGKETRSKLSSSPPPPSLYASVNNKLYAVTFWRDGNRKCNCIFNIMVP